MGSQQSPFQVPIYILIACNLWEAATKCVDETMSCTKSIQSLTHAWTNCLSQLEAKREMDDIVISQAYDEIQNECKWACTKHKRL
jgi:hypothetical protein